MKIFIAVLILIFNLQSWTKADDIRDFEIEGITVGDSALDYYSKNFIESKKKHYYPSSNKYFRINFKDKKLKTYEALQFQFKSGDEKYIIHSVAGMILYEENIEECYNFKNNIVLPEIRSIFLNAEEKKANEPHEYDSTGKSMIDIIWFIIDDGNISASCSDWSESIGIADKLTIKVNTKEFENFINYEAYK